MHVKHSERCQNFYQNYDRANFSFQKNCVEKLHHLRVC
jgi:hypothetical protein